MSKAEQYLTMLGQIANLKAEISLRERQLERMGDIIGEIWLVITTGCHKTQPHAVAYAATSLQECIDWCNANEDWQVRNPSESLAHFGYVPVLHKIPSEWNVAHIVSRKPSESTYRQAVHDLFRAGRQKWRIEGLAPDFVGTYEECLQMCHRAGAGVYDNAIYYDGREVGRLIKE